MMSSVENERTVKKGGEKVDKLAISLKAAIVNTGKKRAELAEILGVAEGTISNWCAGFGEPNVDQLRTISNLSGIPIDYIFLPKESN